MILTHKNAEVHSPNIGRNTKIWQFCVVLEGAQIGENCNINAHCFIENDVVIGNNVTIKCGVYIWDGITIEDNVFIGPNVTFTNDVFPRSNRYPNAFLKTVIRENASIGANATILPGLTIGKYAMVGAGAVVINDIPDNAIVAGNPARILRYVHSNTKQNVSRKKHNTPPKTKSRQPRIIDLSTIVDSRGALSVVEARKHIPFEIKRVFFLYNLRQAEKRGEHAHKKLIQFIIAISGKFDVLVNDGKNIERLTLASPSVGVLVPPMHWLVLEKFSLDAVCMVLASNFYDEEDYIRDYDEFKNLVGEL